MSEKTSLTSAQIRAARALLRWSAGDLADASGLGIATIQRAEAADGSPSMTRANMDAVRRALEAGGVDFIPKNGGGAGVRLKAGKIYKVVKHHSAGLDRWAIEFWEGGVRQATITREFETEWQAQEAADRMAAIDRLPGSD